MRGKGRPRREIGGVGSDWIVESARALLRSRSKAELTRKNVAEAAKITPALVSYYFPDQTSLIYAAIDPIIQQYSIQILAIAESENCGVNELRMMISLFLDVGREDAVLCGNYWTMIRNESSGSKRRVAAEHAYMSVLRFMERLMENEGWQGGVRPDWLTSAIWGMCRSVAEPPILPLRSKPSDQTDDALARQQVEDVLSFVVKGLQSRP